jgi:hypothetical protein
MPAEVHVRRQCGVSKQIPRTTTPNHALNRAKARITKTRSTLFQAASNTYSIAVTSVRQDVFSAKS